jgi:hypothetical protein
VKFDPVLIDGVPQNNFTYYLTQGLERPPDDDEAGWLTPVTAGADKAFWIDDLDWGYWKVWIKVGDIVLEGPRFAIT